MNRTTVVPLCILICATACGSGDASSAMDAAAPVDANALGMDAAGPSTPTLDRDATMEGGIGSPQDGAVPPSGAPPRTEANFVSIAFVSGTRTNTSASIKVASPGLLFLADEVGEMQFELTSDEYGSVLELVLSDEFVSAIRMPNNPDCPSGPWSNEVTVVWRDIGAQSVAPGACLDPMFSDHVYKRLGARLAALKQVYFVCEDDPDAGVGSEPRTLCL